MPLLLCCAEAPKQLIKEPYFHFSPALKTVKCLLNKFRASRRHLKNPLKEGDVPSHFTPLHIKRWGGLLVRLQLKVTFPQCESIASCVLIVYFFIFNFKAVGCFCFVFSLFNRASVEENAPVNTWSEPHSSSKGSSDLGIYWLRRSSQGA